MIILRQYTSALCATCRAHKPLLAEIAAMFEEDLCVEFVDVSTLDPDDASAIATVPFYRLMQNGLVKEQWIGTKSKDWIVEQIEELL